jgi:hypothetical protein
MAYTVKSHTTTLILLFPFSFFLDRENLDPSFAHTLFPGSRKP